MLDELDHLIEPLARRRQRVQNRRAAFGAIVVFERHTMVVDRGVVKGDGRRCNFLNGRNDFGQQVEHLLAAHLDALRAIQVQCEVVGANL